MCPGLGNLGKLLREKYNLSNEMIRRAHSVKDFAKAKNDIMVVQKLITRHRLRCPQCKMHQAAEADGHRTEKATAKCSQSPSLAE